MRTNASPGAAPRYSTSTPCVFLKPSVKPCRRPGKPGPMTTTLPSFFAPSFKVAHCCGLGCSLAVSGCPKPAAAGLAAVLGAPEPLATGLAEALAALAAGFAKAGALVVAEGPPVEPQATSASMGMISGKLGMRIVSHDTSLKRMPAVYQAALLVPSSPC